MYWGITVLSIVAWMRLILNGLTACPLINKQIQPGVYTPERIHAVKSGKNLRLAAFPEAPIYRCDIYRETCTTQQP